MAPVRKPPRTRPAGPTMEDVAARAGVSRALVSIVFRDLPGASESRPGSGCGRRPPISATGSDNRARLLSRKHTRLIGVSFGVGHEFHADLFTAACTPAARERDYELVLSGVHPGRSEQRAAQDLLAFRCDALVLLGPTAEPTELAALGRQAPTVVVARASTATASMWCVPTTHRERAGHPPADGARSHVGSRTSTAAGHPAPPSAAAATRQRCRRPGSAEAITVVPGGLTDADGSRAAERFLALPHRRRPQPVTVFNDQSAIGFLATARATGTDVPGELSVIGYDDSRLAGAAGRG